VCVTGRDREGGGRSSSRQPGRKAAAGWPVCKARRRPTASHRPRTAHRDAQVLNYGLVNHLVDMFTRPSPGLHLAATKTLNILAANNTEARKPLQDGNVLARVVAVLQNGARGDGGGVGWGGGGGGGGVGWGVRFATHATAYGKAARLWTASGLRRVPSLCAAWPAWPGPALAPSNALALRP
jgi:hypothetical protein